MGWERGIIRLGWIPANPVWMEWLVSEAPGLYSVRLASAKAAMFQYRPPIADTASRAVPRLLTLALLLP